MNNIKNVLEGIYHNPELRQTCIPLFYGNPGLGKTVMIEDFAKNLGVNLVPVIASQRMPNEISGLCMPLVEEKRMTYFDYDLFTQLKDGDIISFDEITNTNIMILNACLTILEQRTLISGKKLPDVMIVAAGNPQGATILTPQIKERFIWYDIKYSPSLWKQYMKKYLITDEIFNFMSSKIINESFSSSSKNYFTPRSCEKALKMILKDVYTPYKKELSILDHFVENTTGQTIKLENGKTFMPNEKLSWLTLAKYILNETNSK